MDLNVSYIQHKANEDLSIFQLKGKSGYSDITGKEAVKENNNIKNLNYTISDNNRE